MNKLEFAYQTIAKLEAKVKELEGNAQFATEAGGEQMQVVNTIKQMLDGAPDVVFPYLKGLYERLGRGIFAVDVRDYERSNDRLTLLKVDNKTVGGVIETRTELNHLEYIFFEATAPSNNSSSEMVEGWISVKDRLPEHKPSNHIISTSQKVRIYDKTHGEDVAWLKVFIKDSTDRLSPEQVVGYWIFENTNMKYTTVTHWQPLGKPPID